MSNKKIVTFHLILLTAALAPAALHFSGAFAAPTTFNTVAVACTADKRDIKWESNGDTTLFISTTCNGEERARRAFTFTSGGRVIDGSGNDIGAVPATYATRLASIAATIDAAVASICGAGKCDP